MSPERYQLLMSLFDDACDLDAPAQAALIEKIRLDDTEMGSQLSALLAQDRAAPGALEAGAAALGLAALVSPAGPLESLARSKAPTEAPTLEPQWNTVAGEAFAPESAPDIEFVSTLAEGGMGRVMLARQRSLHREVAVKVLRPEEASPRSVTSLREEAVLSGSLEHPNIVPVHVLGRDPQGLPLLVMKRIEGVSWAMLIKDPRHPSWARVVTPAGDDRLGAHLAILGSVCNALHYAHSRGVLHRDVKPENVMVGAFGEVYLVDWGIAVRIGGPPAPGQAPPPDAPREGRIVGTPGYMAPEMAAGRTTTDIRTDVYLLGATLHHVLTGRPRHCADTVLAALQRARESAPFPYGPEAPEELAAICNRATQRDPEERFPTAEAFRDAVTAFLRHRGSIALSDSATARLRQLQRLMDGGASDATLADVRRVHELMTESLFGFHESLRAWPENPRACAGLRECLGAMIEYEVENENLARAQSLLDEIDDPSAGLLGRVEALRERVREREARETRMRAIERGQDWSVSASQRATFFALMCGVGVVLWRYAVRDQHAAPHPIPPAALAMMMAVFLGALLLLTALFRKAVFATTVNRNLVAGVLCGVGAMLASRCLHIVRVSSATADIVSMDQMVAAACATIGAITLARWLWLAVPIFLGGALCSRLYPSETGNVMAFTSSLAFLVLLLASYVGTRGRTQTPGPGAVRGPAG